MDSSILNETCDLWLPTEGTDAGTLRSETATWTRASTDAPCRFEPLSTDERMAYFGDMDVVGFRLWLQVDQSANINGQATVVNTTAGAAYVNKGFSVMGIDIYDEGVLTIAKHIEAAIRLLPIRPDVVIDAYPAEF